VVVRSPPRERELHELSRSPGQSPCGSVLHMPRRGRELGVHAPRWPRALQHVPRAPRPTCFGRVLGVPRPDRRELGVSPSRRRRDMHQLPRPPSRAQCGRLLGVSRGGRELGVSPSLVVAMRLMPPGTGKPLRERLFGVSFAQQGMEERDVPPRTDPRRRAFVSQLRVRELPSEWLLEAYLREVSRLCKRADG